MYIFKAAVIGAGAMGAEIAQVISYSGLPVLLKDVDQGMLDKGMARIRKIYQGRVDKGKMSSGDMDGKLSLVTPTLSYDEFGDVDIAIEAVPEKMAVKRAVLGQLAEALPEPAIIASNTSALSISEMGVASGRPGKMIGMHFFNPAHVMKLVEVIPGLDTTQETVDDVVTFTESLRKLPIVVQECPGFLVNRLLMPYLNEAVLALEEGEASANDIDQQLQAWGMPMGPFFLMDMLGLDVCADVGQHLQAEYGERMRGAALFPMLVAAGRLGEKSGAGFYGYGNETDEPVKEMIAELQSTGAVRRSERPFDPDRLIMPLINEAALCLQEHIASPADIDLAMVAGIGMTYGGERLGPLAVADLLGLDTVAARLAALQQAYGERFRPARLLRTKVRAGHIGKQTGRGFHEYSN
ncbi:MAG: 3-hydroxyacyl-CoA dehydrogenase [Anaerolineales bacterium]|nr:3-hydroxyacyl-CoA dehydrogenase [Anaerolineales bacterium]